MVIPEPDAADAVRENAAAVVKENMFPSKENMLPSMLTVKENAAAVVKENMFPSMLADKEKAKSVGNALSVRMSWSKVCVGVVCVCVCEGESGVCVCV